MKTTLKISLNCDFILSECRDMAVVSIMQYRNEGLMSDKLTDILKRYKQKVTI